MKEEILSTLCYFDLFNYPLTSIEIIQFLQVPCAVHEIGTPLRELENAGVIFRINDFYCLHDSPALATRRKAGNIKARQQLKTAQKIAAFLSGFPFVQGVAVSGSLSKNYADDESDIDFFIITSPDRLWLARSFTHLFKKLTFLFRKQHLFCMNYYIDSSMLRIKEQNIYTATEIATLLPLRGIEIFGDFFRANRWVSEYLPNHLLKISYLKSEKSNYVSMLISKVFSNKMGDVLDDLLMRIKAGRWSMKTKQRKSNRKCAIIRMDMSKHYLKPLTENFQTKQLQRFEIKRCITYATLRHKPAPDLTKS